MSMRWLLQQSSLSQNWKAWKLLIACESFVCVRARVCRKKETKDTQQFSRKQKFWRKSSFGICFVLSSPGPWWESMRHDTLNQKPGRHHVLMRLASSESYECKTRFYARFLVNCMHTLHKHKGSHSKLLHSWVQQFWCSEMSLRSVEYICIYCLT